MQRQILDKWSYIKYQSKTREGIGDVRVDPEDIKSDKTDDYKQKKMKYCQNILLVYL